MVVRAIKPIKANDIIYENYGPLYMSQPLEERQNELKTNYWYVSFTYRGFQKIFTNIILKKLLNIILVRMYKQCVQNLFIYLENR